MSPTTAIKPFEYSLISDEDSHRWESTPHNPPEFSDKFTSEDFDQEWDAVWTALKRRLEVFGDVSTSRERRDFMLSEGRGDSRWLYITFTSTRLWTPDFVLAVVDLLQGVEHDYRIAGLTELSVDEIPSEPHIYLLMSRDTLRFITA